MSTIWLVEMTARDPGGTERVLRFSNVDFRTGPAPYLQRVIQAGTLRRNMFSEGRTSGHQEVGFGTALFANDDGELDYLLDYGFDGGEYRVLRGDEGDSYAAMSALPFQIATMTQPIFSSKGMTVGLRDRLHELDVPLQASRYLGNNIAPDGVEGGPDLKGKPKPVAYGIRKNVSPVLVNAQKWIFQFSANALTSIDGLRENGVDLGIGIGKWAVRSFPWAGNINAIATRYTPSIYPSDLAYNKSVVVGAGGSIAESYNDGTTWADLTFLSPFGGSSIHAIAYGHLDWVAGGAGGKIAYDITGWALVTSPFGAGDTVLGIACTVINGNRTWVAVTDTGKVSMSTFPSDPWSAPVTLFGGTAIRGVVAGDGRFVLFGDGGKVATSTDGLAWTVRTGAHGTDAIYGGAYAFGKFFLVGALGKISVSTLGEEWVLSYNSSVDTLNAITLAGGYLVAGGIDGVLLTSTTAGDSWTRQTSTFGALDMFGLGGNRPIAVGQSGTLTTPGLAGTYASLAELEAVEPDPGSYRTYLPLGLVRVGLGSAPGVVTGDFTEGANAAARTSAQIWKRMFERVLPAADCSAADITALDVANSAEVGFWHGAEERKLLDALDEVALTPLASYGPDQLGLFHIAQWKVPSGAALVRFTENSVLGLERIASNDVGRGLPIWKTILQYAQNKTVQPSVAASVDDRRRVEFATEWLEEKAQNDSVLLVHPLAPQLVEKTLFVYGTDAAAEATRREAIRDERQDLFAFRTELNAQTKLIDLNTVVELYLLRYGFFNYGTTDGALFRVLMIDSDPAKNQLELIVWRANSMGDRNLLTDLDVALLTDADEYILTGVE